MRALHTILASAPDPEPVASADAWWARYEAAGALAASPYDHAVLAGFAADCLGYAVAAGYQCAVRALVPGLPEGRLVSLCMTERGGGHPRNIETRLDRQADGSYLLTGSKRWATLGGSAGLLLVAASLGVGADGRNRIRIARVPSTAPGVTRTPMPEPHFTPEIAHDQIELAGVRVTEADLCAGDGFARYMRPFRTVEDIHVNAAVMAYLVREVRLSVLPLALAERLAAVLVALRALAGEDASEPAVHVALAGALDLARGPIDEIGRLWASTESPAHARWERDRVVLAVAGSARDKRRLRAWDRLAEAERGRADETSTDG
jgi:hypothetical protein